MLTTTYSAALFGIDGFPVCVECDAINALPYFEIVGLPDTAVKEAKQRVQAAAQNSGLRFPDLCMTVNLAPADRKKEGSALDLAILAAVLQAGNTIPQTLSLENKCFIGELMFSGQVRSVKGVLPMVLAAKSAGQTEIFVPVENAAEAAVVDGVTVFPVENAACLVRHLRGEERIPQKRTDPHDFWSVPTGLDFSEVKGQDKAKRALEIAAAGGHNVLLIGPPGAGKSMLSKRIPSILPPMSFEEAVETTKIHSVSGLLSNGQSLLTCRPFRSPHHTMSAPALVGGGKSPMPGEISLAHHGVLFLDELPEFPKNVTESLRQPLEDGQVTITRTAGRVTFPASFMLICAMNPCKCGYYGSTVKQCTCKPSDIKFYLSKISGPLLDRIDIHVELPALGFEELSTPAPAETSEVIRVRVTKAREISVLRSGGKLSSNALLTSAEIREVCALDDTCKAVLKNAFDRLGMSARGYDRILRVARTIADLAGSERILPAHLAEAIQLRTLDRKYW